MIVTFEQALKLKELGYDQWTFHLFDKFTKTEHNAYDPIIQMNRSEGYLKRPTVSEALQDLRDRYNLICTVELRYYDVDQYSYSREFDGEYRGVWITDLNRDKYELTECFATFPEAESALLTEVIEYLIKKKEK